MTAPWRSWLSHDPLPALLATGNPAIIYFARRDLLGENPGPRKALWELPEVEKILHRQSGDGGWRYPGFKRDHRSAENYHQIETYRQLGVLVEKYGLDRSHPSILSAAEFLFDFQTEEGDFRGIYSAQYSPNYTAGILELLVKAGYAGDARVERAFAWLLSNRLADGGWAIAMRTLKMKWHDAYRLDSPLQPDWEAPFSHMVTGVVLRAFAAHPRWRAAPEARQAGELLASRFFQSDRYVDRRDKRYWEKVSYPFWFTDIVSALDSLSLLGFSAAHPQVSLALERLRSLQAEDGGFDLALLKTRDRDTRWWVALAVCRVAAKLVN